MNKNRLSYKNKLVEDIKQIGLTLERDLSSIIKLKNSKFDIVFIENSVNKINEKIVEKNNRKKELEKELVDLESGVLDDKLNDEYKKNKIAITIKNDEIQKKKHIIAVQKADDVERSKIQQQHSREINNSIKQGIRDVKYYERKFFSYVESLPPYIERNLGEMQNNKGYLWKGIMFFGKLRVNSKESDNDSQELMVFDKQNKDLLIIHEWTKDEYSVYKKIGKNPKTIMSKKVRVNKFSDNLPMFEKTVKVDDVKSKCLKTYDKSKSLLNTGESHKTTEINVKSNSINKSIHEKQLENIRKDKNTIIHNKVESVRGRGGGYRGRGGGYRGRGGVVVNVSLGEGDDNIKKLNEGETSRGRGGRGRGGRGRGGQRGRGTIKEPDNLKISTM